MILFWIFSFLLQAETSNLDYKTEIRDILNKVFTNEELSFYLDRPPASKMPFSFRFETQPVYQGLTLQKQILNIPYRQNKLVRYDTKPRDDENRIVIIIEAMVVAKDTATVKIWVPCNGLIGNFSLHKIKRNWIISKAQVGQT